MKKALLVGGLSMAVSVLAAQQHEFSVSHGWKSSLSERTGAYPNEINEGSFLVGFLGILIDPVTGLNYILNQEPDWVTRQEVQPGSQISFAYRYTGLRADGRPSLSSFGLSYSRAAFRNEKFWHSGRRTATDDRFGTVIADYRLTYFSRPWFQAYMGIGLGVTSHRMEGHVDSRRAFLSGQVTPVGLRCFYKNIGLQGEFGYGARGGASLGLVVRLGK